MELVFIYSAFESTYLFSPQRFLILTSKMQDRVNALFPGLHLSSYVGLPADGAGARRLM